MSTKISSPSTPAAPTTAENVAAYAGSLDAMYQASLKYDPLMAQSQVAMAQQYAPQMKAVNDALNPQASQMNETLATQAASGMNAGLSQNEQAMYLDQMRATLGEQASSGLGADYQSRGLLQAQQQRQDYWRTVAGSVAGLTPVYSGQSYQQPYSTMSGYNYGQVSNNAMQGYGSYSSAYANMYGSNQQALASQNQLYGSMIGGASSMGAAMLMPK